MASAAEIEATGELISAETGHEAHCPGELSQEVVEKTFELWVIHNMMMHGMI